MKTDLDVYETIHDRPLKLGDKVSVTESFDYYYDYNNCDYLVVGLNIDIDSVERRTVNIALYDGDSVYDGFNVFDIEPAEDKED